MVHQITKHSSTNILRTTTHRDLTQTPMRVKHMMETMDTRQQVDISHHQLSIMNISIPPHHLVIIMDQVQIIIFQLLAIITMDMMIMKMVESMSPNIPMSLRRSTNNIKTGN